MYDFKYILPEPVKKKDKGKDAKKVKTDDADAFKEALKDTKIAWLAKLPADAAATKVAYYKTTKCKNFLNKIKADETYIYNVIFSAKYIVSGGYIEEQYYCRVCVYYMYVGQCI